MEPSLRPGHREGSVCLLLGQQTPDRRVLGRRLGAKRLRSTKMGPYPGIQEGALIVMRKATPSAEAKEAGGLGQVAAGVGWW